MRTTLNIDDSLIDKASRMTGVKEKTTLVKLRTTGPYQQERAERGLPNSKDVRKNS